MRLLKSVKISQETTVFLRMLEGTTHSWSEGALRFFTHYVHLRWLRDRDISCPYPYYSYLGFGPLQTRSINVQCDTSS
ncbi:hypothetical protein SCLCIDRAFT_559391 [Scleroderma citrinum Foug A]|uniref:Uncharacterized protein n=1 Tax=Scleroderma citrinum Foug A TaxID=1036808 RepID=A0A0C2YRM4_9AGAM|nr:hypothetical protein SCLCIDRAFT_559391 [Scleroderma citrinum Foug A]